MADDQPTGLSDDELQARFWDQVTGGDRASLADLAIGEWVRVEQHRAGKVVRRSFKVVQRAWVDEGDGQGRVEFRDPRPGERPSSPVRVTLLATGILW